MAHILQWPKGLYDAKCVFIGPPVAVNGLPTSGFVTVGLSTYTSYLHHQPVVYVTVATESKVSLYTLLYLL